MMLHQLWYVSFMYSFIQLWRGINYSSSIFLCVSFSLSQLQSQPNYLLNQYSNTSQYSNNNHANHYPHYTTSSASWNDPIIGHVSPEISKLCESLSELGINPSYLTAAQQQHHLQTEHPLIQQHRTNQKSNGVPGGDYMCHVCFKKDHFIRDCPQVNWKRICKFNAYYVLFLIMPISPTFRHVQKVVVRHHIKVKNAVLVNTNAPNVKESGCLVIRGQIWVKNALNAI